MSMRKACSFVTYMTFLYSIYALPVKINNTDVLKRQSTFSCNRVKMILSVDAAGLEVFVRKKKLFLHSRSNNSP